MWPFALKFPETLLFGLCAGARVCVFVFGAYVSGDI